MEHDTKVNMLPITVRGYVSFALESSLDMKNVLFSLTKELRWRKEREKLNHLLIASNLTFSGGAASESMQFIEFCCSHEGEMRNFLKSFNF